MTLDSIRSDSLDTNNLEWQFAKLIVSFESSIGQQTHISIRNLDNHYNCYHTATTQHGGDATLTNKAKQMCDFIDSSPNRCVLFGMCLRQSNWSFEFLVLGHNLRWLILKSVSRVASRINVTRCNWNLEFVFHLWQCQNWMIINFMGASWTRSFNCLWHFRKWMIMQLRSQQLLFCCNWKKCERKTNDSKRFD